MPNTAATALCPRAAHQTVAISRPRAVGATMMAGGPPRTPAGTTPTRLRPSATEPTMKLPRPRMDGSPASGPTTGAAATSGAAVSSGFASRAVMVAPSLRRPAKAGLLNPYAHDQVHVFSV